jgi:type IV secretion system protein VirB4
MTKSAAYSTSWCREVSVEEFVPYRAQIDPHTIVTKGGDYLQIVKLEGAAHEATDPEDVDTWKERLNTLLRNIASPQLCLWTTVVRRPGGEYPGGVYPDGFDGALNDRYRTRVASGAMMVNDIYLTLIYRPYVAKGSGWLFRMEKNPNVLRERRAKALRALRETVSVVLTALERYRPRLLGTYDKNGVAHSELLELLDYLTNGNSVPRALPRRDVSECLARARPFFGKDAFELRDVAESTVGACLGILEYPEDTQAGFLDALLSAPFPFILTQSFGFLSKPAAIALITQHRNRLETTEDLALSQIAALDECLDDLASARVVYGQHHLVLTVLAGNGEELRDNLSDARNRLAELSMVTAREDWALAAAFWSQLPGNTKYRPRPAPISSRNFAAFSGFHNYPTGRKSGNQWGEAVCLLRTSSGAPYYFNFHEAGKAANDEKSDASQHKALGNTLIIGQSGSGKTVLQGFLMSQSKKFGVRQFVFDKDRGLEIYVRACGGTYLALRNGEPTGFNPFALAPTADNLMFLCGFVATLCGGARDAGEEAEIESAIRGVAGLRPESRRLGTLTEFLDSGRAGGVRDRLAKWCGDGMLAWAFDNPTDALDFGRGDMFGFDVTEFLDNDVVRTPVVSYLFRRMEEALDGGRIQIFMDEFWKLLLDKAFEDFAQNKQKVIRKQNGIMIYGTQSARDVLRSPIAHSLVEQCATFVFMPNPQANHEDYVGGFHLSEKEFRLIKEDMDPSSRRFLIRQGRDAVVAELNLNGFENELAVISGTTDNVRLAESVIEECGDDPAVWLPQFHERRRRRA